MGKTAPARRCLGQASGVKVLSARAGQAEADLDFGLIDQPGPRLLTRTQ